MVTSMTSDTTMPIEIGLTESQWIQLDVRLRMWAIVDKANSGRGTADPDQRALDMIARVFDLADLPNPLGAVPSPLGDFAVIETAVVDQIEHALERHGERTPPVAPSPYGAHGIWPPVNAEPISGPCPPPSPAPVALFPPVEANYPNDLFLPAPARPILDVHRTADLEAPATETVADTGLFPASVAPDVQVPSVWPDWPDTPADAEDTLFSTIQLSHHRRRHDASGDRKGA